MSTTYSNAPDPETGPTVTTAEILQQLDRILCHPLFVSSPRLSAFLRYTVGATLAGQADSLKEFVIGAELFQRGSSFNPQTDNLVRVAATRLRGKLAEYYHHSGQSDPVVIDFPKGRYVPSFSRSRLTKANVPASPAFTIQRMSVGRRRELDRIRAAFDAASSGTGTMLAISGDAGMGKTTIVEDFLAEIEAGAAGVWVARGFCSERRAKSDAFAPIFECLDDLTRTGRGSDAIQLMEQVAPTWFWHVAPSRGNPAGLPSREASLDRMHREFVRLFEALAAVRPVIVFFDDLHWADASTCDLLAYLGSRMREIRLLMVTTYKPAELFASHPFLPVRLSLARRGACHEIPLDFLTLADIESYLDRRFVKHTLPPDFVQLIHERTEGSPLFMTDLVSFLVDQGVLVDEGGNWRVTRHAAEIRKMIPTGSHSLIRLQIDRFGGLDRQILQCAAIQGVEFDSEVVCRALAIDAVEVEERLQVLDRAHRFVQRTGERTFLDRSVSTRYRFVHVFYQNALDADITPAKRSALCLSVANAVVQLCADTQRAMAAQVAMLFECGKDDQRASEYFLFAARHAASVFAHPEAITLCERGLTVLRSLPESRERDARELKFSLILGMAQMVTCGFAAPEVERTHRRSRELCLRLNEKTRLVPVLWGIHTCLINAAELVPALDLSIEMRQVADELGDPVAIVESLHAFGTTHAFMGNLTDARAALDRIFTVLPLGKHKFSPAAYVLDTHVTSMSMLARVLARLGLEEEAMERAAASLALANQLGHPPSLAYATFWVGWILHARRKHSEACEHLDAAMSLGRIHSLPQIVEWGRVVRGSSLAALGKVEEGISEIRTSLDNQLAMRCLLERPYCLTLLAEALVRAGELQEALALCDEALRIAEETRGRSYDVETHRVRREILERT